MKHFGSLGADVSALVTTVEVVEEVYSAIWRLLLIHTIQQHRLLSVQVLICTEVYKYVSILTMD